MEGKADFQHLAITGRLISVRVTPKAARNQVRAGGPEGADLLISVTVVPEDGKATNAVVKLLAASLGIAKSRLLLRKGATSRDKVFEVT
ncbi:MAG: DUF167 domain-containing protein [Proteobacteria bacterium]|nr:DUF167 domain-containing protein [Pseudomonadota bacterium]MDA1285257.1 DUF167 domain-containing protein [Pseudomonadota bacterium]